MPYQAVIPVLQQPNRLLTYNQTVSPPRFLRWTKKKTERSQSALPDHAHSSPFLAHFRALSGADGRRVGCA